MKDRTQEQPEVNKQTTRTTLYLVRDEEGRLFLEYDEVPVEETGTAPESAEADVPEAEGRLSGEESASGEASDETPSEQDPEEAAAAEAAEGEEAAPAAEESRAPVRRKRRKWRRPNFVALAIVIALVVMMGASIRNIVALQIEHNRLVKEHEELIRKRDKLRIELKHVNSREYIEEQARRQLRLVNPDEILFIFPNPETGSKEDGTVTGAEDAAGSADSTERSGTEGEDSGDTGE